MIELFIAPNGCDTTGTGSIDKPFASLNHARLAVRKAKDNSNPQPICVNIRGGAYHISSSINFSPEDSGFNDDARVTYQAYNDEKVTFYGSKSIDASKAKKVTDENILNRILDPYAKTKLMEIDLNDEGITPIDPIIYHGYDGSKDYHPMEVFVNGVMLTISRWPNNEPGTPELLINKGHDNRIYYGNDLNNILDSQARLKMWSRETLSGIGGVNSFTVKGYTSNSYSCNTYEVKELNLDKGYVEAKQKTGTNHDGCKIHFENILDEIDLPGESFIDRVTNKVYFYPRDNKVESIEVSVLKTPMFNLEEGTAYMTFKGFECTMTRFNFFSGVKLSHITIDGVNLSRGSKEGIHFSDSNNIAIQNCHICNLAKGAIYMTGGDRPNLISSNNLISNNRIHNVNRLYEGYTGSPLRLSGVGFVIRNNKIYDAPHMMLYLANTPGINNFLIEYNEFYNGVQTASDQAAVYWGRNPSEMGVVAQYNYFHRMGNPYGGFGEHGFYCDDGGAGPLVRGNVFYRSTTTADNPVIKVTEKNRVQYHAIKAHGIQFMRVENNISIENPTAVRFQSWADANDVNPDSKQIRWFLWLYDKWPADSSHQILPSKIKRADFDLISEGPLRERWKAFYSEYWKNYFDPDTTDPSEKMWTWLWDFYTEELYDELMSISDTDMDRLHAIALKHAPVRSNIYTNNIAVEYMGDSPLVQENAHVETDSYNVTKEQALSVGLFKEYGKDWRLTEKGLAEVRKTSPGFKDINSHIEQIGLRPLDVSGNLPGGREPVVTKAGFACKACVNELLKVDYVYSSPEGAMESYPFIAWFASDSASGEFSLIRGKQGRELLVTPEFKGKYLRYEIVPFDANLLYGDKFVSEVLFVG